MNIFLTAAVVLLIFLNGATDASNAIASAVSSGALRMKQAALLAAVCSTAGGVLSGVLFTGVGQSVTDRASFGDFGTVGVLASLLAVVAFTAAAWLFRIPTSESHALLSAMAGASAALGGEGMLPAVMPAVLWMTLCVAGGFLAGVVVPLLFKGACSSGTVRRMQIFSAGLASFFHGVQDLPKFLSLLLLSSRSSPGVRLWAFVSAALVMGVGTLLGGRRMTEAVGCDLALLTQRGALASDLAAAGALCLLSVAGVPASTTHAKTAAVAGVSLISRDCRLHARQLVRFLIAFAATFPLCAVLGYFSARAVMLLW